MNLFILVTYSIFSVILTYGYNEYKFIIIYVIGHVWDQENGLPRKGRFALDDNEFNKLFVTIKFFIRRSTIPAWKLTEGNQWTELAYVTDGQAEYTINGIQYRVKKGDLLCTQKESLRSAHTYPENLMKCYIVSGPVYNTSFHEIPLPFPSLSHVGIHQDILSMYNNLDSTWVSRKPGYELKARGLYMMILQRFFEQVYFGENEKNHNIRISKAIKYIVEHYTEDLSVQIVCNKVGLSAAYFGNLFKIQTGESFHQFLTRIRLNHAENMLLSGEYNINETATACGFSDPFYFSKVYKKRHGVPPSKILSQ